MYVFLFYFIYPILYQLSLLSYESPTISRNLVGLVDASACLVSAFMFYITNKEIYFYVSLLLPYLYYQWDLYYILFFVFRKEFVYVFHHLIALYIVNELMTNSLDFKRIVYPMFIAAEFSNIFLHMTYHVMKCYPSNRNSRLVLKVIQFLVFTITRILFYTYLLFTIIPTFPGTNFFLGCLFLVYMAGIMWYSGLIRSLRHDLDQLLL